MAFTRNVEETLLEMLEKDKEFKNAFEGKIKSKILEELDATDFSTMVSRGITNMVDYMFTDDSYIYENVRDMVSTILEDNIRISFDGKEMFNHDKESVED